MYNPVKHFEYKIFLFLQADSIARYSPAYTLKDWGLERAGRSPTTPKKTNPNPDRSTEGCDLKEKPESMMQQ